MIELENNLTAAQNEIANLTTLWKSEKERADNLENQNKQLNSTVADLQSQIQQLKSQNGALQSEIAELQTQVAQLNNTITMLESDKMDLQSRIDYLTGIINMSRSLELKTLIFHVCEKGDGYSWGRLPNAISTYNEVLALNNGVYEILFLPEYKGNENWTEASEWIRTNFKGIPLMLSVFEGGNKATPVLQLNVDQIAEAVATCNVRQLRIAEIISWYLEHPNLPFPAQWVTSVLEFARNHGLKVQWGEWKVNENVFQRLQNYTKGYEDIVTVTFQTNSGELEPADGFMLVSDMFPHWGGGVQSWYWVTRGLGTELDMPPALLVQHALSAKNMGAEMLQFEPYWYFFDNGNANQNLKLLMTMLTQTTPQHLPLYERITGIKNRLTINITDSNPNFTNNVRVCDFYELREESSEEYFQTTVDYWVFQNGQGEHGDIEAFVEIYNVPNRTDLFIVEVTRFSWFELTVSLDGSPLVIFPTITNNTLSPGYMTFEVTPKFNIGIFYYPFYDQFSTESWDRNKIIDTPTLGLYDSSNATIIRQHLEWIEELDIDFVILSWWGPGTFTDNAIKQIFSIAEQSNSSLEFAIMVEPFQNATAYDYTAIYNYIYDEFVVHFPSVYYNHENEGPLICFFNDGNLTHNGTVPKDERFNAILVGQESYVQWIYTDLNCHVEPTSNPYTSQTSVTPRYDDSRVPGRNPNCTVDANLTGGTYDSQWENALKLLEEGKIETITITSWNEHPERTAIEPHVDATAENPDPWFLYNKTRDWIATARGT
jgi:FtsZ-binding cell division protein ZapB